MTTQDSFYQTELEKAQETHARMMEGVARGNRLGDADMAQAFRELAAKAKLEVERLTIETIKANEAEQERLFQEKIAGQPFGANIMSGRNFWDCGYYQRKR